jgi:hypothetical protein
VAAYGAGEAIFIHLTYVDELTAILRCPVVPLFEDFSDFRVVKA